MKHLVLIGDIVDSRSAGDRAALQRRLKAAVASLNRRQKSDLRSPFTITLGDEFQAVYRNAQTVFGDLFFLLHALAPTRVRFALAVGGIETPLNRAQAIGMDGPAFHQARDVMNGLKKDRRLFGVGGLAPEPAALARPTLAILSGLLEAWRDKRLRLMAGLLEGTETESLAAQLGITVRAVNKNIRSADLDEWKLVLRELSRIIDQALRQ